ncbi:MAG: S41 family peptidase [Planctomycetota bacterium]|nr:MAG: S41 family peptidase [Planctomycetota bacterium]
MHAWTRRLVGVRPLLYSLAVCLLWPAVSGARAAQPTAEAPGLAPADAWAKLLWQDALHGQADTALGLLAALPDEATEPAVQALKDANVRRLSHLQQAEQRRATRLQEAWGELEHATEKNELRDALRLAVEISTLTQREGGSLNDPRIQQVAAQAEREARKAEEAGDWLTASELFGRLNLLYDTQARYRDDVRRVGRRLQMMRLYTPKRLHDMRSQRLVEAGEDPLPPFNEFGESWQRKLAGVDEGMVVRAISYADRQHVEGVKTAQMVVSGLDALKTLATTGDLAEAFPAIGDKNKVKQFLEGLANEQRRFELAGERADFRDLIRLIGSLRRLNDSTLALPWEALVHEFGNGAMDALDDFSSIIWPDEIRQFQRTTRGSFTGVGIQIMIDDADRLVVVTPLDGTPARKAGIRAGDIIRMIDGHSTIGITSSQAVDLITGPAGTKVTLSVERQGVDGLIDFEIVRAEIPLVTVKGWERNGEGEKDWNWWIDRDNRIGYIRLNQFTEDTVRDFDEAVQQMLAQEGSVDGLILDLRYNPGGLLSSAVEIVNRFVREGVVVTQRDAKGRVRERQRARPGKATLADTPLVVLINEGSASASEIVSGALQDLDRAVIVGARSFGKGSVQNVYDIGQGLAAMRLTTQYYYLPSGRLIHRKPGAKVWGIEPDVHVAMLPEQIAKSLRLRQDADIRPEDRGALPVQNAENDEPLGPPEPQRLIAEGIDPQLETALLLLQTQTLPSKAAHAMLPTTPVGEPAVAGS